MVNYQYAELFKKDSIDKQLTIETDDKTTKITNVELHQEQFELTESICSESELTIGSCEAAVLKFTVSNIFLPMKDKMITVKTVIDNNTANPFQIGRYKVYSDTPTADRTKRDIVAYDALYDVINADVAEWYNTLLPDKDSVTTMKAFRDSFFGYFGIEQADAQLVNDDMKVEKTVEPEELSGATVLNCICEINGCFGHIGRDSKFHYIYLEQEIQGLYPRNNLYPADDLYPREPKSTRISKSLYISAQYEDFLVKTIDKLQIRKEEDDIGVIVGSGTNAYVIQDNFLVYGKGSEELTGIANNIYGKIRGIIYRPFSADCKGNPCIEVGDAVRLPTKYEIIESYVLKRTLKGIQALRDEYEATGEEYRSTHVNSVHKSIIQLKGKTNVLTRTIEETNSKITDVESGLSSEIKQTATDIRTEVKNTADGLSSSIEQTANSIRSEVSDSVNNLSSSIQQNTESITSEVKRASEAEGNLSTKITQTAESITSEISKNYETKENATNTKTELESSIKQTADGFTAELSKQVTETKQYAESAAETAESNAKQDTADKLKDYSTTTEMNTRINATAEGISAEVTRKLQSYSTTEQMNSAIRQTADSINTEVSKKVNGDEIISKINQSAENVSIEANKINLNGAVTANQNFKIGLDGSMEALSGLIGEWQIFDGYLRYVLGENAQALLKPDELLISRSAGANFHAYPGLLYMQSDDGERSISIDCNDGSINLGGSWTTPWGDIEG
uniref:tail fiber domain-containing protein n=1 Tax=Lachnospira sp. TaxID=2049031 RepID=UPI004027A5DC